MCAAAVELWLGLPRKSAPAVPSLLCFPYAGAGAVVFRPWQRLLEPAAAVVPVFLPGREQRLGEAPIDDLGTLVALLAEVVAAGVEPPFAFFGHSFGALLAFELTRELRRRGLPLPCCLFASGRPAPSTPILSPPLHLLPDQAFVAGVSRRFGGIPGAILAEPDLLALFVPALRADLKISECYRYQREAPLPFPIFALGGRDDERVSRELLEPWADETVSPAPVELLDGGHFFVNTARGEVVALVAERLRRLDDRYDSQGRRP